MRISLNGFEVACAPWSTAYSAWTLRAGNPIGSIVAIGILCAAAAPRAEAGEPALPAQVDTALVISIDVSSSVNARRYQLQLEGIAAAIEDRAVVNSVLSGPAGAILVGVVAWADRARLAVPWTVVRNAREAAGLAARIRSLEQQDGAYTCLARMLHYLGEKVVPRLPVAAAKTIVDVSGDGPDNCNSGGLLDQARGRIVAAGATINGLPILGGEHADTLEGWYRENVIGGDAAFIMPAMGYDDFARAFRQKFVVEMSAVRSPGRLAIRNPD